MTHPLDKTDAPRTCSRCSCYSSISSETMIWFTAGNYSQGRGGGGGEPALPQHSLLSDCRSHSPAHHGDPHVPTLSTPRVWLWFLTILKPTNTLRASPFLPPWEIRSHTEVSFDSAFSGLTHQTSVGSSWKQDWGWPAGHDGRTPQKRGKWRKRATNNFQRNNPWKKKQTERLSQLPWPWAAVPPGSVTGTKSPSLAGHQPPAPGGVQQLLCLLEHTQREPSHRSQLNPT